MHQIPQWVYIVFTAVTAVGVLMQALVLLGMLVALKGALTRLDQVSKLAEQHLIPTLATGRKLLDDVAPQLKVAADNLLDVSRTLRHQSGEVSSTLDALRRKTEVQAERVDEMVTGTLNSIAHATAAVQRTVAAPVRKVEAVLNGLRAGFDVLRSKEPEAHASADGDHFV
jgi:methyl-accepting chemotaxis protein